MEDIVIRKTMPEDAEAMLAYLKQIGGETDNLSFGSEGLPISIEEERAYIQSVCENPRALMLTAWRGGMLVGDCSLRPLQRRMQHRAELGIAVIKAEWNKKIASRLLEQVIAFAKTTNLEIVSLEVNATNLSAIHLYEKFGFRHIATFPRYMKIGEKYADMNLMTLEL